DGRDRRRCRDLAGRWSPGSIQGRRGRLPDGLTQRARQRTMTRVNFTGEPPAAPPRRQRSWMVGGVAVVILAAAGAGVVWWWHRPAPVEPPRPPDIAEADAEVQLVVEQARQKVLDDPRS